MSGHDDGAGPSRRSAVTFDPYKLDQMKRFARLPLSDKVDWLEQMHRLALRWGAVKPPPR